MKTHSVSWRHDSLVYSTQWAQIPGATPAVLPGPTTLRPLGHSYFRYMVWHLPGLLRLTSRDEGGLAYVAPLVGWPVFEFGKPRLGTAGFERWVTFPVDGGLAAGEQPSDGPAQISVPDDPVGRSGLLRIAARLSDQGLWIGVELEAFTPRLPPDSLPYRLVQLPLHGMLGRGFLRWWHAHLGAFAEPSPAAGLLVGCNNFL